VGPDRLPLGERKHEMMKSFSDLIFCYTHFGILTAAMLLLSTASLFSQTPLQLHLPIDKNAPIPTSSFSTKYLFPQHIVENPMGFSPLCRMEVKIERQLPVAVWMRLDGNSNWGVANPGLAYLRFKVPLKK
jgi:hypothetical protein